MTVTCPECKQEIELDQEYQYHFGFSNLGVLYCDRDPTVLTVEPWDENYRATVGGGTLPWMLTDAQRQEVEAALKPCPCGGSFSFDNPPLCPHCGASIQALVEPWHFIIPGRLIEAEKAPAEVWKKPLGDPRK